MVDVFVNGTTPEESNQGNPTKGDYQLEWQSLSSIL